MKRRLIALEEQISGRETTLSAAITQMIDLKKTCARLLCCLVCYCLPLTVFASAEITDQGLTFLAERDPEALAGQSAQADGNITQPLAKIGKTELYTGGRLENFMRAAKAINIYPESQKRGLGFVTAKRRLGLSTELELELGAYLGERDYGGFTTVRAAVDLQAFQMTASLRAEPYRLLDKHAKNQDYSDKWDLRSVGDVDFLLRGLGPLPDQSELKFKSHFEKDFGSAFKLSAARESFYGEAKVYFTTPFAGGDEFDEKPESRLTLSAYGNTLRSFDIKAQADWFLKQTRRWEFFADLDAVYLNEAKDIDLPTRAWAKAGIDATFIANDRHTFIIEPALVWNIQKGLLHGGTLQPQLFGQHDWRVTDSLSIRNKLGFDWRASDLWYLSYKPQVELSFADFGLKAFVRGSRAYGNFANTLVSRFEERAVGGEVSFYKLNYPEKTFDLALAAEYIDRPNGENDLDFKVKLKIAH